MTLRRLLFIIITSIACLDMTGTAHAGAKDKAYKGAYNIECTVFYEAFPGAVGGRFIVTPNGSGHNHCKYP